MTFLIVTIKSDLGKQAYHLVGEVSNTTYLTIVQDPIPWKGSSDIFSFWETEYNKTYKHTHAYFVLLFSKYIIFNTEREKSYG